MTIKKDVRVGLGGLTITKAREFRPIKSLEDKKVEAAQLAKLVAEWLEAGNLPDIGEYSPEKDVRVYKPAQ